MVFLSRSSINSSMEDISFWSGPQSPVYMNPAKRHPFSFRSFGKMALMLSQYDYSVELRKKKREHENADALSHLLGKKWVKM